MSPPVRGDRSCRDGRGGAGRVHLPTHPVMQRSTRPRHVIGGYGANPPIADSHPDSDRCIYFRKIFTLLDLSQRPLPLPEPERSSFVRLPSVRWTSRTHRQSVVSCLPGLPFAADDEVLAEPPDFRRDGPAAPGPGVKAAHGQAVTGVEAPDVCPRTATHTLRLWRYRRDCTRR